ncbi:MAG: hypothetical protein IKW89_02165 [Bacteroidales bacterium]|nr:hypothetical protein [Bacteroidales bacterium]
MRKTSCLFAISMLLALVAASGSCGHRAPRVEGNYVYEHGWNYDISEGHIDVHETGTMDFFQDGTALDSARQVYSVTLSDGGKVKWVFNYISPSRWRVEGEDFYFAGEEDSFRMELIETFTEGSDEQAELAARIIKSVSGGIGRETKFHLAELSRDELVWSYTYPDGHTDTWEFRRR